MALDSETVEPDVNGLPIGDIINRTEKLNKGIALFWSHSNGWAPATAANLLGKSRLDRQASLSASLILWVRDAYHELTPAELILGWINLGILVEGTIKTFLSVYYEDYAFDVENLKESGAFDFKKKSIKEPDRITLDILRKYCELKSFLDRDGIELLALVQKRRNAVHAFQDHEIGNDTELQHSIRRYLVLLRYVHGHFPYPDGHRSPREF